MRFDLRQKLVISLVLFAAIFLPGCQNNSLPGPYTFEHAKELEKLGKEQDSLTIYTMMVRDNQKSKPDLAAQALYEGGLFAKDPIRYGKSEALRNQGQDMAVQMWKQLRDDFPKEAQNLLLLGKPGDKFLELASMITARNSSQPGFKIIDMFVKLTGSNPNYSYGIALLLIAVVVRTIVYPLTRKQYAGQREMQRMQPLIKELQVKYKGKEAESRVEMNEKTMALYKEHGVNPFASCIPSLIQLPFLIMVFGAIRQYEFAFAAGKFLWVGSPLAAQFPGIVGTNLASPDMPLLVLYVITNYVTMRMTPASDPQQQQQQSSMALITSVMFFWMFLTNRWSSAFILYWLATNAISIYQQYVFIYKPHKEAQAAKVVNGVIDIPVRAESSKDNGTSGANNGVSSDNGKTAKPSSEPTPPRARPRKKK